MHYKEQFMISKLVTTGYNIVFVSTTSTSILRLQTDGKIDDVFNLQSSPNFVKTTPNSICTLTNEDLIMPMFFNP